MRPSKRLLFYFCFCIAVVFAALTCVTGQAQTVDSLERALEKKQLPKDDRLQAYDDLSWAYLNKDADKAIYYGKEGVALAKKLNNSLMQATLLRNVGVAYYMNARYDSAEIHLHEALKKAVSEKHTPLEGKIHSAFGNLYNHQSDYARALDHYLKSLRISESIRDQPLEGMYNNIAVLYQNLQNEQQAMNYFERARMEAEKTGNRWILGSVALAMTNYYKKQEPARALRLANEARDHFKAEEDLYNEILATLAIGEVHRHNSERDLAIAYTTQGLQQAATSSFPKLVAEAEADLSSIYFDQGDYTKSIVHARQSWEKDSSDFDLAGSVLFNMARSYIYSGKPDSANQVLDRFRDWITAHSNEGFQKSLSEMEVKYETEKKNLQIAAMEQQRKLYIWLSIAGAALLLTALGFFISRHRLAESKRRLAEQRAHQMQQEKQLVSIQAALDGEAAERSRLAKDLHDGLGSMLSVVKLNLPEIRSGAVMEAIDVSRFHNALNMLDDSIQELRRVAHHMMPESLLRHGLRVSLSDFCDAIPGVAFHSFGEQERLSQQLETLIYRCVHELVNNALKHAQATTIGVQLVQEPGRVSFTVQDNGVGFDSQKEKDGMGLKNVRQRIEAFQGKLSIYSSAGKGTEVHAEFALPASNQST